MRRYSLMLLVALLAIVLGLGAIACGSGDTAGGQTPEEAFSAALDNLQTSDSQSGTYEIAVTIDADSSGTDPMLQSFLGQPIVISGDFASQMDPALADMSMGLDLMGFNITAGVRAIDDQAWLNFFDQWYEIPAEDLQPATDTIPAELQSFLQDALGEQGIDPNSWLKDQEVVGEETLGDITLTHLSGTIDFAQMFTDVFSLLQNPELMSLLGEADALGTDAGLGLPDTSELQEAQDMLDEMIQSAALDLWIDESDSSLRKVVLAMEMTIPEEEGADMGIGGLDIAVTMNFDAPGTAIEVSAPASSKPLSELETDMQSNPLLSGFGSLLGSGSGIEDLLGQ